MPEWSVLKCSGITRKIMMTHCLDLHLPCGRCSLGRLKLSLLHYSSLWCVSRALGLKHRWDHTGGIELVRIFALRHPSNRAWHLIPYRTLLCESHDGRWSNLTSTTFDPRDWRYVLWNLPLGYPSNSVLIYSSLPWEVSHQHMPPFVVC